MTKPASNTAVSLSLMGIITIAAPLTAPAFDIVTDGQPKAVIIVAAEAHPGIRLAAEDLRFFIEKISGASLPIADRPPENGLPCIYVGENEFTEKIGYKLPNFKGSGYDILVEESYVVLSGANKLYPPERFTRDNLADYHEFFGPDYTFHHVSNGGDGHIPSLDIFRGDDIGAWHAVSALLERLGVRFYSPYIADGAIIPEKKAISLETGRETRTAAFDRRMWYHFDGRDLEGNLWLRRMKVGSHVGALINHTTMNMVREARVREEHPEWLARDKKGNFVPASKGNSGGIPRYTNPDFIRACVHWAQRMFDAHPTLEQLAVGAPDESKDEDAGYPLDYEEEMAYRKEGMSRQQAYVNVLWDFHVAIARELKKSHPDKYLVWWTVYADAVPSNIVPDETPDNILVRMEALSPGNAYIHDSVLQTYKDITAEKYAKFKPTSKSQQWEWWLDYWYAESPRYPEFFMQRLQEVRQYQVNYFNGFFMETLPKVQDDKGIPRQAEMSLRHLMMYVNSKLMWDPDLDLQALLNEYYSLWFGPASREMKAFHEFAEQVWMRQASRSVSLVDGFLKPQDVTRYFELLEAARLKTAGGSVYRQRVEELMTAYSGLKTIFADRTPGGEIIRTAALQNEVAADGDFSKYGGDWIFLKGEDGTEPHESIRTSFKVSVTQDKQKVLLALRINEDSPDKAVAKTLTFDQGSIYRDDHIRIDLNTPQRNWFSIVVNLNGATYDKTTDLELINQYALQEFWTPGVTTHVEKKDRGWEMEVAIPTTDFGDVGPTEDLPWGINVTRTRFAGGDKEEQSVAGSLPATWLRIATATD